MLLSDEVLISVSSEQQPLTRIGCKAPPLEGWQVDRMQEFVSDRTDALYDRVLVCWCVPMSAEADSTAA